MLSEKLFDQSELGQYMVEFALGFVVFVFFMIFVIDIGLLIYNHNLFYNAVYRGARQASLGASNEEITNTVVRNVEDHYFPTMTMMAKPEEGVQIRPEDEIDRVQGKSVRVSMESTFGINFFAVFPATVTVPIQSEELITKRVDRDRDGLKDDLEPNPDDHDNDGAIDDYEFDGTDLNADSDAITDQNDTVVLAYFNNVSVNSPPACPGAVSCIGGQYSGYAINRNLNLISLSPSCEVFQWNNLLWQTNPCFDGDYHAPEIWDDEGRNPPSLFSKQLPTYHVDNGPDTVHTQKVNTVRDTDNDGWIDKYDNSPTDPTSH